MKVPFSLVVPEQMLELAVRDSELEGSGDGRVPAAFKCMSPILPVVSGSSDTTIQVWEMATGEAVGAPFRGHTDSVFSVAISPDGKHIVSGSSDNTIRVWDIEFLNRNHPSTPAMCFSPNSTHALHSASSFLEETLSPYGPNEEGWVVGPEGRLLLWIPLNFHPVMYAPGNTLVIPNNALQLDLSCLAHGTSWHECRTQDVASSS
ncbi:WD40-repeat-containing domain protein [Suillus clintonianus]|uniref:WD40-repeat-containing domain protein n=1 Tax=Suillus clintonianus TaxID=1904413 RepID=UPI001B87D048|nr:WD40-repeat-containing domain protein [Suillus clintonianus]KAG2133759.1 WD40-repeat-containing domain protein [Suillus clintonianus]